MKTHDDNIRDFLRHEEMLETIRTDNVLTGLRRLGQDAEGDRLAMIEFCVRQRLEEIMEFYERRNDR